MKAIQIISKYDGDKIVENTGIYSPFAFRLSDVSMITLADKPINDEVIVTLSLLCLDSPIVCAIDVDDYNIIMQYMHNLDALTMHQQQLESMQLIMAEESMAGEISNNCESCDNIECDKHPGHQLTTEEYVKAKKTSKTKFDCISKSMVDAAKSKTKFTPILVQCKNKAKLEEVMQSKELTEQLQELAKTDSNGMTILFDLDDKVKN